MMFGIGFSMSDSGRVKIDGNGDAALNEVRASKDFESLGGQPALDAIIVTDGTSGEPIK